MTSAPSFPAAPTTSIPASFAFWISEASTELERDFLAYRERLMKSTSCAMAYSIPATIEEIVPRLSSPRTRTDRIFAFGFCSVIASTISEAWLLVPTSPPSIIETWSMIFGPSAPVSRSATTLLSACTTAESCSPASVVIGLSISVAVTSDGTTV